MELLEYTLSLYLHDLPASCESEGVLYAPYEHTRHDESVLYVNASREATGVVTNVTNNRPNSHYKHPLADHMQSEGSRQLLKRTVL